MVQILRSKEERKPFWQFGSREVGYAAAFGGLGFALRVLGIFIPVLGPYGFDPRDLSILIGSAFCGPFIGTIVDAVIGGLPATFPWVHIYILMTAYQGICFNYIRHPWYYLTIIFNLFVPTVFIGAVWMQMIGILPFWPGVTAGLIDAVIYTPIIIVIIEIMRRYSPALKKYL